MTTRAASDKRRSRPRPAVQLSAKRRTGIYSHNAGARAGTGFDAAASNRFTNNHFADASASDIDTIIAGSRAVNVMRCRYEFRNNAYCRAMVNTWVNEIIGTGPTLAMQTGNDAFDTSVEDRFREWSMHCDAGESQDLTGMLQTGLKQLPQFGEEFTTFTAVREGSRSASRTDVKMRLLEINPQRVGGLTLYALKDGFRDGVRYDPQTGAPIDYQVLDAHPAGSVMPSKYVSVPSDDMIHLYLHDEAEQKRGWPMMASVLTLMGDLRRYTKAVVAAAEQAANISGVVRTQNGTVTEEAEAMDELSIARNALLTLPAGYDISQFKAEQPTGTYGDFKHELIAEIGRAFFLPFLLAAGNAQNYNYASGRLDLQDWWKAKKVVQDYVAKRKLDWILERFLREGLLIDGYFKGYVGDVRRRKVWELKHAWNWPGNEHVDPVKEATAEKIRLESRTLTLAESYAARGRDWDRGLVQASKEKARMIELGLTDGADGKDLTLEERLQKIYLAVGVVITAEEARKILNDSGANLSPQLPASLARTAPRIRTSRAGRQLLTPALNQPSGDDE